MARTRAALAAVATAFVAAAGVTIALPNSAGAATTLKQLADARGKDVGFAMAVDRIGEAPYKAIADPEFNLVVAENAMKWQSTEPTRGQFSFAQGDQVASYAAQQGKTLYGHTLVWHNQLAPWVEQITSGTDLLAAMRNHVTQVAAHYSGQVEAWDVVNEAFEENGSRRQSIFQQRIGNSYIEEAFRAARAADPEAKLCINDYNTDGINAKSTAILNLVRDFKARGVPIDCVGFQAHLIVNQVPGDLQQNLQRFIDAGVSVRITELDIRMPTPPSAANLQAQRDNYRRVFAACVALAACEGVTVWGITDRYSWVPDVFPGEGAALLWDDNYNKKPAYDGATEGLGGTIDPTTTPASPPTTNTSPSPGACAVTYQNNSWNTGFTANVVIRNTGSTAINGWILTWTFANGQVVTNAWNATVTQSGGGVTARNVGYNPTIPANGGSQSFGFQGTHSGTNSVPASFSLNGGACAAG